MAEPTLDAEQADVERRAAVSRRPRVSGGALQPVASPGWTNAGLTSVLDRRAPASSGPRAPRDIMPGLILRLQRATGNAAVAEYLEEEKASQAPAAVGAPPTTDDQSATDGQPGTGGSSMADDQAASDDGSGGDSPSDSGSDASAGAAPAPSDQVELPADEEGYGL